MSDIRTVSAEPGLTLDALNTVVAQTEPALGPLVDIGNDGHSTLLGFNLDLPPPSPPTRIVTGSAPGALARGDIFVENVITPASTVRS